MILKFLNHLSVLYYRKVISDSLWYYFPNLISYSNIHLQQKPPHPLSFSFRVLISGALPNTPSSQKQRQASIIYYAHQNFHTFTMDFVTWNSNCLTVYPSPRSRLKILKGSKYQLII